MRIKTKERVMEVSWFDDMSDGDTGYLGVRDAGRASTFEHCLEILQTAERNGFKGALLPTAYDTGLDPLAFALAAQQYTKTIHPIVALRMGEIYPTTLSRQIATLDKVSNGRFIINAISSDYPGQKTSAGERYARTGEVLEILIQGWERDEINFKGKYYNIQLDAAPAKCLYNKRPLIYFGGISPEAKDIAARYADVYLMWPETMAMMRDTIEEVSALAAKYGRVIDFGLRIHMIVRPTEQEARAYAGRLVSKLNDEEGLNMRAKHQDAASYGVYRQDELRKQADADGFIEPLVWSYVGKVFSGCGSALVGSGTQVIEKLHDYMDIGFRAFIHSGFPLIEEADYFGKLVMPHLPVILLSEKYTEREKAGSTSEG
ncbi:MAG: alkanesulfonate monooxygenase [Bacteroidetes bacterium]|nr:alkanesulfonate monooxygenase [Bacteroidota bacterium]